MVAVVTTEIKRKVEKMRRRNYKKSAEKKANCICNLVIDNTKNTGK